MKTNNLVFTLVTVFLVGFIAMGITFTVKGQEPSAAEVERETYYRAVEEQLLGEMKAYLNEQGFTNSGVTLNRVVDQEENREYTFTIHHSRIDKMDEADRSLLVKELTDCNWSSGMDMEAVHETVGGTPGSISFSYDFLIL